MGTSCSQIMATGNARYVGSLFQPAGRTCFDGLNLDQTLTKSRDAGVIATLHPPIVCAIFILACVVNSCRTKAEYEAPKGNNENLEMQWMEKTS